MQPRPGDGSDATQPSPVSFGEAFRFWLKLGFISFGGPAGQIAMMHRELVDQKRWVPEGLFLRALNFSMLLPGPAATELAIYIAWRMHGIPGGIVAGTFFVLPSIFVLLVLSWLAVAYTDVPALRGLLYATLGALITVYATFLPTFFYVFLGAPYIGWLSGNQRLQAALTGVTAAVVGVIANLAVFFGVRVLFPETGGFDTYAAVVAVVAFIVLRRFPIPTYWLVPAGALAGMVWVLIGPR